MAAYEYWRVQVQFTPGTWTDVTSDVDGPIRSTNGATPETTGEPASMSLVLHNPGFKYTPGNTLSATALATGMPIRFFEVILDQYIYHFTGFVEFPEIASVNLSMTQSQTIAVSAVDQLSSWERSATFVSTLAEYIKYNGGSSLLSYWPMNEVAGPTLRPYVGSDTLTETKYAATGATPTAPVTSTPTVIYADGDPPLGDEVPGVRYDPNNDATNAPMRWVQHQGSTIAVAVSGNVIAVALWIRVTQTTIADLGGIVSLGGSSQFTLSRTSGGNYQISANDDTSGSLTLDTGRPIDAGIGVWRCVAMRLTETSGAVEFWHHGDAAVTSVLPGATSQFAIAGLRLGGCLRGQIAHLQIYVGPDAYNRTQHLAQVAAGYNALERQTTGDRIRTIARYAGLTDGQLVNVDTGCSIMQGTSLAGLTVAQAMYEARDTEQGDLFIDGTGALTFHDRRTILNI